MEGGPPKHLCRRSPTITDDHVFDANVAPPCLITGLV
jgi:hypothetical protein